MDPRDPTAHPGEPAQAPARAGAFRLDLATDRVTCTPGLVRILEQGGEQAPSDRSALLARVREADRPRLEEALGRVQAMAEPCALSLRLSRPDLPVHLVLLAEAEGSGRPRQVVGTVEEGGDPAQPFLDLGGLERELREVLDSLPYQVFVRDAEGRILLANRAFAGQYGLTPSEVVGRLQTDVHPDAEEAARMLADDREVIDGGRAKQVRELPFRDAEGRRRFRDSFKMPFRMGRGQVLLGLAVDVTERRRALDSGERLREALRQSVEGIALLDARGRIVFANPALARMLEMREEDLFGAPFSVLSSGTVGDSTLLEEIRRKLAAGQVWTGRYESCWQDGSRHLRDASVAPVRDGEGRFLGSVGVLRDITREVELEEELHQAQKMEALGRLSGGIAHDFNNVLTVISSCAEELEESLPRGSAEWEAAQEIARAAERSAQIIGQLLSFSRRQPFHVETVELNSAVEGLVSMLARLLPDPVRLELALDPRVGAVRTDRGQLERAVLNLVLNARDAMPEGGELRIETGLEVVAEVPRARLSVVDTGVGMDDATRQRAFEPFFTTKGPGKGSGLGLAAVLGFARQSDGSVAVESEPGQGTRVDIHLPCVGATAGRRARPATRSEEGGESERVLVVEDEDAIRSLVERTLVRAGYRVRTAADGFEALELLEKEGPVDLVLADVRMPRMSGMELRRILAESEMPAPVLLMSGFPGTEHGGAEAEVGLLAKPFRPSTLLRVVRSALAGRGDGAVRDGEEG